MSCYEWEQGQWTLSVVEYSKFAKAFREEYNKVQDASYQEALALHAYLAAKKAKGDDLQRFFDCNGPLYYEFAKKYERRAYWSTAVITYDSSMPNVYRHRDQLVSKDGKLITPKKKGYPHATNRSTEFSVDDGEAGVVFKPKERRICWYVTENNRACERARESRLGRAFFRLLSKVNWTRGTGGSVWGNDEYHRDSDYEGGGGNFNKGRWGNQELPKKISVRRAALLSSRW